MALPQTDERLLCGRARRQDDEGNRVSRDQAAPCTRPAGWGTPNAGVPGAPCKFHTGSTPAVIAAYTRRRVELECSKLLSSMDISPITDPVTELEAHLDEMVGWRDVLRSRLGELDPKEWRRSGQYGEELHALVALYTTSLRDVQKALTDATKIGIEGRRVQLDEERTAMMAAIVETWLRRRGIDPETAEVRGELHEIFVELEGA